MPVLDTDCLAVVVTGLPVPMLGMLSMTASRVSYWRFWRSVPGATDPGILHLPETGPAGESKMRLSRFDAIGEGPTQGLPTGYPHSSRIGPGAGFQRTQPQQRPGAALGGQLAPLCCELLSG